MLGEEEERPSGVRRAVLIATFAASFLWIPYVVPGLEELRVVGPHDPLPLSDLLAAAPRHGAGLAGAFRRARLVERTDEELLALAPLPPPLPVETPRDPPPPTAAVEPPAAAAAEPPAAPQPAVRVEANEYRGLTREIEDPSGSLRHFYARLAAASRGRPVLARMGIYGTSTNGGDRMTAQLRRLLQARFGDGGKGWVPLAAGWRFQRHQDVEWTFDGWRTFVVNRGEAPLGRYGFGGVLAVNRSPGAVARFATTEDGPGSAVSRYRLFYQAWPGGGRVRLSVDGEAPSELSTRADTVEDRVLDLDVEDGPHELTVRPVPPEGDEAQGDIRLYGVTMERPGPGVVVDGLALIGAFTRVLLHFDPDHLDAQVRARRPDLLVFWMGANDAVSRTTGFVHDAYVERYRQVLRRFRRSRPAMSCMVMAILDKGRRVDGHIRTIERVPRLVAAQREVAQAEGCAFFDTFRAMGGEGTMRRWYENRPRLVTDDLGHLTGSGSRVMGTLLYRALLAGFDGWLGAGEPGPGEGSDADAI